MSQWSLVFTAFKLTMKVSVVKTAAEVWSVETEIMINIITQCCRDFRKGRKKRRKGKGKKKKKERPPVLSHIESEAFTRRSLRKRQCCPPKHLFLALNSTQFQIFQPPQLSKPSPGFLKLNFATCGGRNVNQLTKTSSHHQMNRWALSTSHYGDQPWSSYFFFTPGLFFLFWIFSDSRSRGNPGKPQIFKFSSSIFTWRSHGA